MARRTANIALSGVSQVPPLALIDENGGYFVNRLKDCANPMITDELRELRGRAVPLESKEIQDVAEDLHRQYIDVEVEVSFQRREYVGTQSWDTKRIRIVGALIADDYHPYITNPPRSEFLPCDLATIYRCRWEVELFFRELKT